MPPKPASETAGQRYKLYFLKNLSKSTGDSGEVEQPNAFNLNVSALERARLALVDRLQAVTDGSPPRQTKNAEDEFQRMRGLVIQKLQETPCTKRTLTEAAALLHDLGKPTDSYTALARHAEVPLAHKILRKRLKTLGLRLQELASPTNPKPPKEINLRQTISRLKFLIKLEGDLSGSDKQAQAYHDGMKDLNHELDEIEQHVYKPLLKSTMAAIQKTSSKLTLARSTWKNFKFANRFTHLEAAKAKVGGFQGYTQEDIDSAKVEIASAKDPFKKLKAPIKAELQKLVGTPPTFELLDQFVKQLPDNTDPYYFQMALTIRCNMKFTDVAQNKAQPAELKRMYTVMTSVPAPKPNNKLGLERGNPGTGSLYKSGVIVLGDGPEHINTPRTVGGVDKFGLQNIAEISEVAETSALRKNVPPPNHFDWNILHEMAHALQDADKTLGTDGQADWRDHNEQEVADAVATHFSHPDITKAVVLARMKAPTPDPGEAPKGKVLKPQGTRMLEKWVAATKATSKPWANGAAAMKQAKDGGLRLGDRIYHNYDAKAAVWCSYLAAAREHGVSGYQFKAEGEWFAELYTAYAFQLMKPSHPDSPWLDKIFNPRGPNEAKVGKN
jgi:hypothetical protein